MSAPRWLFEVDTSVRQDGSRWEAVRPSASAQPYRYATREEAERMARMCYPDQWRIGQVRVRSEGGES